MPGGLTQKELLFCSLYAALRNGEEAARGAGYRISPRIRAEKLLMRREIRQRIDRISEQSRLKAEAAAGFRRLAFGGVNDAVSLLISGEELNPERIREMDFFNVSELKQSKSGQLEVRFFDRQKALEMLLELSSADAGEETRAFFEALNRGAKAAGRSKEDEQ